MVFLWCLQFMECLLKNNEEIGKNQLVLGQGIKILGQMADTVINIFTILLKSLV